MSYHSSNDPFESTLDSLFEARTQTSADFTARTLARIRSEAASSDEPLEEWIENELASARVQPSAGFTERTCQRARRAKGGLIRFPFPLIVRTAAGIAAAVAMLFTIGRSEWASPAPEGGTAATTRAAASVANPEIDSATATLLMLADGLDRDARWLLQSGDDASLLALAQ